MEHLPLVPDWLLGLFVFLLIVLAFWPLLRYLNRAIRPYKYPPSMRRIRREIEKDKPIRDVLREIELGALKSDRFRESGDVLSAAMRLYLGRVTGLRAAEMTAEELHHSGKVGKSHFFTSVAELQFQEEEPGEKQFKQVIREAYDLAEKIKAPEVRT